MPERFTVKDGENEITYQGKEGKGRLINGRPEDMHADLLPETKNLHDLGYAVAEVRRSAGAYVPEEINQLENGPAKEAILKAFINVGNDVARLAIAIERVIESIDDPHGLRSRK